MSTCTCIFVLFDTNSHCLAFCGYKLHRIELTKRQATDINEMLFVQRVHHAGCGQQGTSFRVWFRYVDIIQSYIVNFFFLVQDPTFSWEWLKFDRKITKVASFQEHKKSIDNDIKILCNMLLLLHVFHSLCLCHHIFEVR